MFLKDGTIFNKFFPQEFLIIEVNELLCVTYEVLAVLLSFVFSLEHFATKLSPQPLKKKYRNEGSLQFPSESLSFLLITNKRSSAFQKFGIEPRKVEPADLMKLFFETNVLVEGVCGLWRLYPVFFSEFVSFPGGRVVLLLF